MKPLPYNPDSVIVTQEMCDHNGNMNVNYYYQLFDSTYTSFYIDELGFDEAYMERGFSTFTLEDSLRYLKAFRLNDVVYPSIQLYKANKKLLHFIGILQNKDDEVAAIFETVLGHIDLNKRKIVNFSDQMIENLLKVSNEQRKISELLFEVKLHIKDINE